MNTLSFKDISLDQNSLFLDYLYDYPKVAGFFAVDRGDTSVVQGLLKRLSGRPLDRSRLADVLLRQNRAFGGAPAVLASIEKLRHPSTAAVVTGQQMGLFGGPMLTLLKAIATVLWCNEFKKQWPAHEFVPVFWLELEDHDFQEVSSVRILTQDNQLKKISYGPADPDNRPRTPIGNLVLENSITAAMEEMRTQLGRTDFSEELFHELRSAYRPGRTMGEGFARWLARLLGGYGLVLMDPSDPEFKVMAAPLFRMEIEDPQTTNRLLAEQSAAITARGYTPQLDGKPTNLFLRKSRGDRLPYEEPGMEKFRLTPEHAAAHRAALLDRVAAAPESFIPNVALRPIVQDHLLPTFAYVAGPSEIAYWAQLKPLYGHFGVIQPMVLPRPFATLVEKKIAKILDRNGLLLPDLLNRPNTLVDELVLRQGGRSILSAFERWAETNRKNLDELGSVVGAVDASLRGAVETAGSKIDQAISVLRDKTLAAEKRNSEQLVGQIQRAVDHLCPAGSFQERKLASLYFLNKYNWNFVEFLFRRVSITAIGHQVIAVEM